ncbi:hydroxyacid dehydrogenase [Candidatus Woesearchaeota archaeon]|nr:hydroxyacid dehydrogenase [Candidatus Woesearchaeota archaeon]
MKIAFFEIENWEKEFIKKELKNHKLTFFNDPITKNKAKKIKDFDVIAIFIYSNITKDILNLLPKLKLIATMSTGIDHIDIEECNKRKIKVKNVPFYGENTVAEHTFGLILALSRKICESHDRTRKDNFSLTGLEGFDLKDKTIGIIGVGHIGSHVARIAKGFEMNILGISHDRDLKLVKETGIEYTDLNNLLRKSNIITLHVPYTKETHHMINKKNIKLFKKNSLLINTARGGLIDTEAILYGLKNNILLGVGLDVLEGECFIKEEKQLLTKHFLKECDLKTLLENHMLLNQKNVIITPHSAFYSKEALLRIIQTTIYNIKNFK